MLDLRKIAITGGLACGKSSVCRLFKEKGAFTVSADDIVHQLMLSDTNLGQKIIELLGKDIIVDQKIDRSRVAEIVFNHLDLLEKLEALIHPAVYKEIERRYQLANRMKNRPLLFVAEVPLLFETAGEKYFNETIVVITDKDKCLKRFMEATGKDATEFDRRMSRQMSVNEKSKRANFVIENNGSFVELEASVIQLIDRLIRPTNGKTSD